MAKFRLDAVTINLLLKLGVIIQTTLTELIEYVCYVLL